MKDSSLKQLIMVASLKAYDLKRSNRKQSRRTEETKRQLKAVSGVHAFGKMSL